MFCFKSQISLYFVCATQTNTLYYTCKEFNIVNIQASGSESLSNRNSNPNIQVPPSKGRRARILIRTVLYEVRKFVNKEVVVSVCIVRLCSFKNVCKYCIGLTLIITADIMKKIHFC